jgi:hypothetical protein
MSTTIYEKEILFTQNAAIRGLTYSYTLNTIFFNIKNINKYNFVKNIYLKMSESHFSPQIFFFTYKIFVDKVEIRFF